MSEQKRYAQDYSQSADFWKTDDPAPVVRRQVQPVLPERRQGPDVRQVREIVTAQPIQGVIETARGRTERVGNAVSHDSAMTIAEASLRYAAVYSVVFAVVAIPVAIILIVRFGLPGWDTALGGFLLWGAFTLVVLYWNRALGLWHSATGIGHHYANNERHTDNERHQERMYELERRYDGVDRTITYLLGDSNDKTTPH